VGGRWIAPRRIAEIRYRTFHQRPFAAAPVGASPAACRACLRHLLRHGAHRPDVFEAELELRVEVDPEPGDLEVGFAEGSGHVPHREEPDLVAAVVDGVFDRIGHLR
jgi:pimeloyl-ACP methyl ester carboxylesterase